jgi:hypothetical protein
MKTKIGMLNAIVEVDLTKRDDMLLLSPTYDFNLSIFQLSDTAFVTSHKFNCVTKGELLELSENIKKIALEI